MVPKRQVSQFIRLDRVDGNGGEPFRVRLSPNRVVSENSGVQVQVEVMSLRFRFASHY